MSPKNKLYRFLIILAVIALFIMLINLWINKSTPGTEPITNKPQEQTIINILPASIEQPLQNSSVPVTRSAITIIKRPPKEKQIQDLDEKVEIEKQKPQRKPTATAKSSPSSPGANGASDELVSGITETSKRPTAIQKIGRASCRERV